MALILQWLIADLWDSDYRERGSFWTVSLMGVVLMTEEENLPPSAEQAANGYACKLQEFRAFRADSVTHYFQINNAYYKSKSGGRRTNRSTTTGLNLM